MMAAQPRALIVPTAPIPQAPGALVLRADELSPNDLIQIINAGPQITLASLATIFSVPFGPFYLPPRVVAADDETDITTTDVALLVSKTIPGATLFDLPTPALGRVLVFKDMAGNAETFNITLDAGAGKTINGQQTLVMNANYGTTMLLGMSTAQWGTLI